MFEYEWLTLTFPCPTSKIFWVLVYILMCEAVIVYWYKINKNTGDHRIRSKDAPPPFLAFTFAWLFVPAVLFIDLIVIAFGAIPTLRDK